MLRCSANRRRVSSKPFTVMACTGMSVFVAFFVLLLLLADSTPPAAASIPLIGMSTIRLHFSNA